MEKQAVNPWTWQEQFGFMQGNLISGGERVLYCSGQVSVDEHGSVVNAGDMAGQMHKALDNVETVLAQAGMSKENVVKLVVFVTDMQAALAAYASVGARIAGFKSAQTLIGVNQLAFADLMVEIDATAVA